MRIIAGRAKGRKIQAPPGWETRPVTDRIKEALFNIWQPYLSAASFLDLFSGSGSMGIEAMSRGASFTFMVDQSPKAIRSIQENIARCGLSDVPHQVCRQEVLTVLSSLKKQGKKFDIIYVDPPFMVDELFEQSMQALSDGELLEKDGMVAIRTRTGRALADHFVRLQKFRVKTYGESQIHFYQAAQIEDHSKEGAL